MAGRHVRTVALGVAAVGAAHALPALSATSAVVRRAIGVRDRIDDRGSVALTFDDGPHPRGTPAVLEALRDVGVAATFFLVGEQVRRWPAVAADVVAAGHAVAVHADRHRNLLRVGPLQLRDDLRRAEAAIWDVGGALDPVYRPPYGVVTGAALQAARARGWEVVLWSRSGRDWRAGATPDGVTDEVAGGLDGGEILLLHDSDAYSAPGSWRATVAALPGILERITAAGLGARPL